MTSNEQLQHRMVVGEGGDAIEVVLEAMTGEVEVRQLLLGRALRFPAALAPHLGQALIHLYAVALDDAVSPRFSPQQAT